MGGPASWNSGSGWLPLNEYTATFRGNGHTISYLYVNRSPTDNTGLFGILNTAPPWTG